MHVCIYYTLKLLFLSVPPGLIDQLCAFVCVKKSEFLQEARLSAILGTSSFELKISFFRTRVSVLRSPEAK